MPVKKDIIFSVVMAVITAFFVSIVLVSVNVGVTNPLFLFVWLRSWLIAAIIATFSILFIAPRVRKLLDEKIK